MAYGLSTEGGYGIGASTDHVDASHADRIDIPDAELLFRGHFARSGPDLVLTGQDGHRIVVTGYFTTEKHPDLIAPNGAHLNGDLVDLLAGSPTPGQYAQARTTLPQYWAPNENKKLPHPFRTRLETERDFLRTNVDENREKSTPLVKRTFFGTRGSQVQILPL
jgi:hypothetical protein